MDRLSPTTDLNENSTESNRLYPSSKRRCQSPNSQRSLPNPPSSVLAHLTPDDIDGNNEGCKFCGKQERLLKTFNCPSLHCFCLNCIFTWTQNHVQNKTSPKCLVATCGYALKVEDLDDLPIAIKDHQVLLQLVELKIPQQVNNLRVKCDKCDLYIDRHNFYTHRNECSGRSLTIPCEICYCPVLINDYEQHMMICNNDDNSTLARFLLQHLQSPSVVEKNIKAFINTWQRKHRGSIDVYEMIEEFNRATVASSELCEGCKNTAQAEDFYFIHCDNDHSLCSICYRQHVQNQMNNNQILSCYQCDYHLQDRDLSEMRIFTNEEVVLYQNYQTKMIMALYYDIYGKEDDEDTDPTVEQQTEAATATAATVTSTADGTPRRKCELCSKQHSYGDIFVLNCNCKMCYDCFANDVNRQRTTTNELLLCALCRTSIKRNDLANLRLAATEIEAIQLYQQGKLFEFEHAIHFNKQNNRDQTADNTDNDDDFGLDILLVNQQQCLPKYWTLPMLVNFARHTLDPQSTEYKFVSDKFIKSWAHVRNQGQVTGPPAFAHHLTATRGRRPVLPPPPSSVSVPSANNPSAPLSQPGSAQIHFPGQMALNQVQRFSANPHPQPPPPVHYRFAPIPHSLLPLPNTSAGPSIIHTPPTTFYPGAMYAPSTVVPFPQPVVPTHLLTQRSVVRARRTRPEDDAIGGPTIVQIERIQNQRWFKQYSAHDYEFRQKLGKQSEQWLFHGCDERSSKNIEMECFNRSYAGQHAVAFGQGCYFARDSLYSHSYAVPDRNGIRRMFLARVLVGKTAQGNQTMRVPPPGFDTTGDGQSVFVTYHDSQAYAEYLISYR